MTRTLGLLFWVLFMILHHHSSHQNSPEMLRHAQGTASHQDVLPMWWAPTSLLTVHILSQVTLYHLTEEHSTCPGPEVELLLCTGAKHSLPNPPRGACSGKLSLLSRALYFPPGHFKCPDLPPHKANRQAAIVNFQLGWGTAVRRISPRTEHELNDVQRSVLGPHLELKSLFPHRTDVMDANRLTSFNNSGRIW